MENPKFKYKGKSYEVVYPKLNIPGVGILTALEIASEEEVFSSLVDSASEAVKQVAEKAPAKKAKEKKPEDEKPEDEKPEDEKPEDGNPEDEGDPDPNE